MFRLIKLVIWLVGLVVVSHFILGYFGYQLNTEYFKFFRQSQSECEAKIRACKADFLAKGYENPDCQIKNCIIDTVKNSEFIIKK